MDTLGGTFLIGIFSIVYPGTVPDHHSGRLFMGTVWRYLYGHYITILTFNGTKVLSGLFLCTLPYLLAP